MQQPQALTSIPTLGQPWPGQPGRFCGISTNAAGQLYALILLDDKPETRLTWGDAMAWAAKLDADLPNRAESASLFALSKDQFEERLYWTNEQYSASIAWTFTFNYGDQRITRKSYEGSAVAVRRLILQSFSYSL